MLYRIQKRCKGVDSDGNKRMLEPGDVVDAIKAGWRNPESMVRERYAVRVLPGDPDWTEPTPPKRKRGRPRKNPLPTELAAPTELAGADEATE